MDIVKFNRVWDVNTEEGVEQALQELEDSEFCANMSDDYRQTQNEIYEIKRQRRQIIRQAKEKGILEG